MLNARAQNIKEKGRTYAIEMNGMNFQLEQISEDI